MRKSIVFLLITCAILLCVLTLFEKKEHFLIPEQKQGTSTEAVTDVDHEMSQIELQKKEYRQFDEQKIQTISEDQKGNYAFDSLLNNEQKQLYLEILGILQGREEDIIVSSTNVSDIDYIFQCVMADHPEIFYVTGYTYTKYMVNDDIKKIGFTGTYTMDEQTISDMQQKIDAYVTQCFSGLTEDMDDYARVKYIYEYMVANTEYDLQAMENQNICSVCVYGKSVCQGYAKTMQYLLNLLDIKATLVVGRVNTGEGHAWNLVQIDGSYYYVDVTWGDAFYQLENVKQEVSDKIKAPAINYDYLLVTTRQLTTTHEIDNIVPMPECVSMEDNYYVREGLYFEQYDAEKVQQIFAKAYAENRGFVTLKCADTMVYQDMLDHLIKKQVVFDFLETEEETIAYTSNEDQNTFTFWL